MITAVALPVIGMASPPLAWTVAADLAILGIGGDLLPVILGAAPALAIGSAADCLAGLELGRLEDLLAGRPLPKEESVHLLEFEKIVDIAYWKAVEQSALPLPHRIWQGINNIFRRVA